MKLRIISQYLAAFGRLFAATATPISAHAVDKYVGEVFMFGGNFCPRGSASLDGQLLKISEYSALFSLLGTQYGGDGRTTFALPNLQSRAPVHGKGALSIGEAGTFNTGKTDESENSKAVSKMRNTYSDKAHFQAILFCMQTFGTYPSRN